MTTWAELSRVIERRFAQEWNSATPVRFDNVPWQQPVNADWVWLTLREGDSSQASIESNPIIRDFGVIMLQLFTPVEVGTRRIRGRCDTAAAIFRRWTNTVAANGRLICYAPSIERGIEANGWLGFAVNTRFRFDRRLGVP